MDPGWIVRAGEASPSRAARSRDRRSRRPGENAPSIDLAPPDPAGGQARAEAAPHRFGAGQLGRRRSVRHRRRFAFTARAEPRCKGTEPGGGQGADLRAPRGRRSGPAGASGPGHRSPRPGRSMKPGPQISCRSCRDDLRLWFRQVDFCPASPGGRRQDRRPRSARSGPKCRSGLGKGMNFAERHRSPDASRPAFRRAPRGRRRVSQRPRFLSPDRSRVRK